jgi:hypothetical protein
MPVKGFAAPDFFLQLQHEQDEIKRDEAVIIIIRYLNIL